MSGIAGIFHPDGRPVSERALQAMTDAVAYRGPDGIGHWAQDNVGLGHLQLRTTPESLNEQQPLISGDGNYVIVCDGRVDNREELIRGLRALAPVSAEMPDAALILHSYIAWGAECLQRIIGDFAFVIWDRVKQRLFCARDRLGIRPFYYRHNGRGFLFGSEANSLLQHPEVSTELNEVMVGLYLSGAFGDGEQTFYSGIYQLPAGHFLMVSREGLSKYLYWELEPDQPLLLASDEEYIQRFRELFQEAVRCRLRSATPVAVTLSGGLDSSSIICAAENLVETGQMPPGQLHSFSAVFSEFSSADESRYIQAVRDRYRFQSHLLNADGYWSFKPLQGDYPLPSHPFPVPHQARHEALLNQIQDANIRVELTGEGGDEVLFAQASSYFWHLLVNHNWSLFRKDLTKVTPAWRRYFYRQVLLAFAPNWLQGLYRKVKTAPSGDERDYSIIDDSLAGRIGLAELVNTAQSPKKFKSPYWQDQYTAVQWFGRTFFLSYYAQAALWHGVEARFPFLDARLVDFVCRAPPQQKILREGRTKWLLRQAMRDILPEPVRQRPDKGDFSPLFVRGLEEIGESRFNGYIENGYLTRLGFVDKAKLARLFAAASTDQKYPVMRFICFLSLEEWLQQLFAGRGSSILINPALPINS